MYRLKSWAKRMFWPISAVYLLFNSKSYLRKTGWIASLRRGRPVTAGDEVVLPWMNYAMIEFLQDRLRKSHKVFEFGSGYSTIFFATRVLAVTSVENCEDWYQRMAGMLPANADTLFCEADTDGHYCRSAASTHTKYDVVVIDGRDRVNCMKQSIDVLTHDGVIIFDDSNRGKYSEAFDIARSCKFRWVTFTGLKPTSGAIASTTLFYRDSNCLGI